MPASAPPNYVFTICAFVAFFLCLIKFPMQFHAWSVGTHLLLAWVGLQSLFMGINSIIWNNNTVNWAPVWCDITTRFDVGIAIAIPATVLCINRRLYLLVSSITVIPSQADQNREVIIDLVLGIGLPIIAMVLAFFVQYARFEIVEDIGCSTPVLFTWVTIIIISLPPLILEIISGVYGCLSIHAFYSLSNETRNLNLNLDPKRYIRLICFSTCDLICGIPLTLFCLYLNIKYLVPFPGLTQEHYEYSQISQLPAVVWRSNTLGELSYELNRWLSVLVAFVFFAVFGFTEESRNNYRTMFQPVVQFFVKITGIKSPTSSGNNAEGIIFYNAPDSEACGTST